MNILYFGPLDAYHVSKSSNARENLRKILFISHVHTYISWKMQFLHKDNVRLSQVVKASGALHVSYYVSVFRAGRLTGGVSGLRFPFGRMLERAGMNKILTYTYECVGIQVLKWLFSESKPLNCFMLQC